MSHLVPVYHLVDDQVGYDLMTEYLRLEHAAMSVEYGKVSTGYTNTRERWSNQKSNLSRLTRLAENLALQCPALERSRSFPFGLQLGQIAGSILSSFVKSASGSIKRAICAN